MYSPGMITNPKTVPISIPPAAAVPMDLFPTEPAPDATHSGINPAIKANEVIKIGRKRCLAPSIAAGIISLPSLWLATANSTIKMAFLASNPINITKATWA